MDSDFTDHVTSWQEFIEIYSTNLNVQIHNVTGEQFNAVWLSFIAFKSNDANDYDIAIQDTLYLLSLSLSLFFESQLDKNGL